MTVPPQTGMQTPDTNVESSDAKNNTALAISWSVPRRFKGTLFEYCGAISVLLSRSLSLIVQPGAT